MPLGVVEIDPAILGAFFGLRVERAELVACPSGEQRLRLVVENERIPVVAPGQPLPEVILKVEEASPGVRLEWELLGRPFPSPNDRRW